MTHKEENIVNIAMRAAELLQEGRIQRSEMTGHAGLTDMIISLADQFERENIGADFDAEGRDYWLEIDAFAERQLLNELGVEHPEPSRDLNIKVIITDGIVEEVLTDKDLPVQVEVIDVDDNYEDYDQLKAYREELYHDPSYHHCLYTVADFKEEIPAESDLAGLNRADESLCEVVAVVGNTEGGTVFQGTWDECREFCESNQWCFWDQNNFRWELETRDPREDRIPIGFYTALDHYSKLEGRDLESGVFRDHADALVFCHQNNLPLVDFYSWSSMEIIVEDKLSFDEFTILKNARPDFIKNVLKNDAEFVNCMKDILNSIRAEKANVRPSLADQIKSAAETAAKAPTNGKSQDHIR